MNSNDMDNILNIKKICDKYNDYAVAGNEIFQLSVPLIEKGEIVIFNMEGQDSVSTVFLNACFGHLIDKFGLEKVKKSFRFTHILRSQIERIGKYYSDYEELCAIEK